MWTQFCEARCFALRVFSFFLSSILFDTILVLGVFHVSRFGDCRAISMRFLLMDLVFESGG
jgi:hypothetical protein